MGKHAPTLKYQKGKFSRHTDAAFNSNEADAFMAGAWVYVRSSNVSAVRWGPETGILTIQFKDGSVYHYPGFDRASALGFGAAPSKGGYVHDWLRTGGHRV
jgi:hypothetical protein